MVKKNKIELNQIHIDNENLRQESLDQLVSTDSATNEYILTKDTATNDAVFKPNLALNAANITDATDKRFITDAQQEVLNNTSGTNTGDETNDTIKNKLGAVSLSQDGYLAHEQYQDIISRSDELSELTDVNISNPQLGEVIKYNGNTWVNGAITSTTGVGTGVIFYPTNIDSDISGYKSLDTQPSLEAEIDEYVTINNNKILIKARATGEGGLQRTIIDAGIWEFMIWGYAQETVGAITSAITGSNKFKVAGDVNSIIEVNDKITVKNSTGNDGEYTVYSLSYSNNETEIVVLENIVDSTADGTIYRSSISGNDCKIILEVYKRTLEGEESLLFTFTTSIISTYLDSYTLRSVQPSFNLSLTDRLVTKLYAQTSLTTDIIMHTLKGGAEHYPYIKTPIVGEHNDLDGLQGGQDKEYYHLTSAQLTNLNNQSGTNTGDETSDTIKNKLGAASASNSGYLTLTDWATFNNKLSSIAGTNLDTIFSSNGFLIRTDIGTYSVDTNTYLTSSSSLNADNIDNGTLSDNRLSDNIPLLDAKNNFIDTNRFPQVGIGMANSEVFNPLNPEKLLIHSDDTTNTPINAIGNIDDYCQLNVQNLSNDVASSSDIVATANNGTASSNYVNMGINSSNFEGGGVGGANDGYVYTDGGNLVIGTATGGKNLIFFTNGGDSVADEKLRIDYEGLATFQNNIVVPDGTEINHVATVGQLNTKQDDLNNINGIIKGDGAGNYSAASSGTDYLTPTGNGSGLTNLTKTQVGLSNVTNDAQLKASQLSTDGTFAANSDTIIPSQKASKTYIGSTIGVLEDNINEVHMDIGSSGLVSGGIISINTGNNALFDVTAGYGYLKYNGSYIKVSWDALSSNSTIMYGVNYIAINSSGTLTLSAAKQTSTEYINLGHVFFTEGLEVIRVVWNLPDRVGNYSTINSNFVNNCFGTIIASGFNVSEQTSPNQLYLNFSEGELWINLSKFTFSQQTEFVKIYDTSDNGIIPDLTAGEFNKVNTLKYNDTSQTHDNALVTMTDNYYKKDLLVMNPNGSPYYVYGDAQYATEDEAIAAPLPLMSEQLLADGNAFLFTIVCKKGDTSIVGKLYDIRPMLQRVFGISNLASGGTVVNYNDLVNKPTIPTDTNQLTNGAGFITKSSLDANSPLSYDDNTGIFSISAASLSQNGYITNTDYSYFSNKLDEDGDGSSLTGITASQVGALSTSDTTVTKQGNTFNGVSQLIQTTGLGLIPALNGSLITNLSKTQVGLSNVPNTDCTNATNISSGTLDNGRLSSSVTLLGNTFNGNSQLVQTTSDGKYPALNGSSITNITASQVGAIPTALSSTHIIVGNNNNVATSVDLSGDATISNTGVITISSGAVSLGKIATISDDTYLGNVSGDTASPSAIATNTAFNVNFETTASNIKSISNASSVGVLNTAARADHVHPNDAVTTTSSSITLSTQEVININPTTSLQAYLPLAASYANKEYTIKNIGVGTVNVVVTGSDTIEGRTNIDIYTQNALLKVKSDGNMWRVIGYYSPCASGYLFLGNTQGQPQALQMSGDGTISAAGVLTIATNAISVSNLAQAGANTYLGNATGSLANVSAVSTNTAFNVNFETNPSNIEADGAASVGSLGTVARADHVHPASTSRGYAGTYVEASNTGNQSISGGSVAVQVNFPTESQDLMGEFSGNTFTSLSVQVVQVSAQIMWAAVGNTARRMGIMIYKNNVEVYRDYRYVVNTSIQITNNISVPILVANGDTIKIYCLNGASGALNISSQRLVIRQMY